MQAGIIVIPVGVLRIRERPVALSHHFLCCWLCIGIYSVSTNFLFGPIGGTPVSEVLVQILCTKNNNCLQSSDSYFQDYIKVVLLRRTVVLLQVFQGCCSVMNSLTNSAFLQIHHRLGPRESSQSSYTFPSLDTEY